MTAAEFKSYFLAEYDAATSLSAPGWEDDEISAFLNIAQDSIVTELYKVGEYGKLSELINTLTGISCASHPNIGNAVYMNDAQVNAVMLSTYFYHISSRLKLTRTHPDITDNWIPTELIERTNASKFFVTPFNQMWFKYPKIYVETVTDLGTTLPRFVILVDVYTTIPHGTSFEAELTYIKKPERIDITLDTTTELNESIHKTIVALAVEQAVKSIKAAKISNQ